MDIKLKPETVKQGLQRGMDLFFRRAILARCTEILSVMGVSDIPPIEPGKEVTTALTYGEVLALTIDALQAERDRIKREPLPDVVLAIKYD